MSNRDFEVEFPLKGFLPAGRDASVRQPQRDVPVVAECEVAVFGGGPAGACAAAAAARAGKSTVLLERYGFLGGMATAGDVNVWHKIVGEDGQTPVIGGLPVELIERLEKMGGAKAEKPGGGWAICSERAKFAFDDLVLSSGVKLMLHTWLADVLRDGDRVTAALVENKSGRGAIVADTYIDCTGDADLVRRSGAETVLGDNGRCQSPSLCFRMAGRPADNDAQAQLQRQLVAEPMDYNGRSYPCHLWGRGTPGAEDEIMLAGTRVPGINAADAGDFTRAEVEARYQLRWILGRMRGIPGWEKAHLSDIATQLGVRETYRIVADHRVTREEILGGKRFDDAVIQGTYPVDIHATGGAGIVFEYLSGWAREIDAERNVRWYRWDGEPEDAPKRDTLCWQAPYRCMTSRGLDNVLAAGRCVDADHAAAGAIRVMINCMQLGQAAGTAAAIADGASVHEVDTGKLRAELMRAGVPLLD
ncbi:MAG: FAD-dependent oxidoreductase [Phycisphaerae bacterium]